MRKSDPSHTNFLLIDQIDEDDFDPYIDIEAESWHDTYTLLREDSQAVPIDTRFAFNADGRPSLARWEALCEHAEAVFTPNSKVVFFIMNVRSSRTDSGNQN